MIKIKLMLACRRGVQEADLDGALRAEAARIDRTLKTSLVHQRAYLLHDNSLRESARASCYTGGPSFDATMELSVEASMLDDAKSALSGFSHRFAGLIDPDQSGVVAGTVKEIVPGFGPIHIAITARRLPEHTHETYIEYWYGNHADEARETDSIVSGLYYNQFHAHLAVSKQIAANAGLAIDDFDGMSETYFRDAATLEGVYNAPGVWERVLVDEQRFVDHSRSVLSLLRMAET